jgi:hypothetical protein
MVIVKIMAAVFITYAFCLVFYAVVEGQVDPWAKRMAGRLTAWLDEREEE